jgi:hypothetical protein
MGLSANQNAGISSDRRNPKSRKTALATDNIDDLRMHLFVLECSSTCALTPFSPRTLQALLSAGLMVCMDSQAQSFTLKQKIATA